MTSSNGNIFHWRRTLMFSLICIWTNGWVNNRNAGDLRRYCAHYDVTVKQAQENDTSNGWRSIFHNRWGTKTYACVHAQGPIRPNGIDRQQEINAYRQCYPSLTTSLTPAPAEQDGDKITGNDLKCNFVKVIVYFLYFLPWLFFLECDWWEVIIDLDNDCVQQVTYLKQWWSGLLIQICVTRHQWVRDRLNNCTQPLILMGKYLQIEVNNKYTFMRKHYTYWCINVINPVPSDCLAHLGIRPSLGALMTKYSIPHLMVNANESII